MNHVAIDLGGKESQICIRQPDGTIIEERKVPTRKLTEVVATWFYDGALRAGAVS